MAFGLYRIRRTVWRALTGYKMHGDDVTELGSEQASASLREKRARQPWPEKGRDVGVLIGSRPSDHYFHSVCLFVCLFVSLCRVFLSRL